jgi:hypothetical protein
MTVVYHQYEGKSPTNSINFEPSDLGRNKMMDLLTACPNFGSFFSSLDKKNKRMVISITEFVEFKSTQKLINAGTPVNEIIVVIKGELIFFG